MSSNVALWIVTGINSALIALVGGFTYFGLGGITRVVTKTGAELTKEVAEVSEEIPTKIAEAIKEQGDAMTANVAGAATSAVNNQVSSLEGAATNQVSSLTGDATGKGLEMMSKMPKSVSEVPAGGVPGQLGGGKQTKGNKPKRIRKPRTKKNIKKVGNQMYMNFTL